MCVHELPVFEYPLHNRFIAEGHFLFLDIIKHILISRKPPIVHIRYNKTVFLTECLMKIYVGEK